MIRMPDFLPVFVSFFLSFFFLRPVFILWFPTALWVWQLSLLDCCASVCRKLKTNQPKKPLGPQCLMGYLTARVTWRRMTPLRRPFYSVNIFIKGFRFCAMLVTFTIKTAYNSSNWVENRGHSGALRFLPKHLLCWAFWCSENTTLRLRVKLKLLIEMNCTNNFNFNFNFIAFVT